MATLEYHPTSILVTHAVDSVSILLLVASVAALSHRLTSTCPTAAEQLRDQIALIRLQPNTVGGGRTFVLGCRRRPTAAIFQKMKKQSSCYIFKIPINEFILIFSVKLSRAKWLRGLMSASCATEKNVKIWLFLFSPATSMQLDTASR
jgi:hypothetical protein